MTLFGGALSGLCCGGVCNTPPEVASYSGGWWGAAVYPGGAYLTRLPSFVTDPDWVGVDSNGRYVWNVRHETDSVQAPDIVSGGVTYRCVGVAGSQYADGSWFAPARASVVWYQLHYAPLNDFDTQAPRAALACVQVGDHSTGAQQSDPDNHEATLLGCWLVNDANGDTEHWDAAEKLCHYFTNYDEDGYARKTVVGPEHFAYQVRRLSSGAQDRITYYAVDQATPTVVTYTNQERGTDSTWRPLFFSSHAFPMALWARCDAVNYYGSGRLQNLSRQYRHGKAVLPSLSVDESEPAANVSAFDGFWSGADDTISDIVLSDTAVYVIDYEMNGKFVPSFTTGGGTVLYLNAGEAAFNEDVPSNYAGVDPGSVFEYDLIGTNYRFGGCGIFVVRQEAGSSFGFNRFGGSAKPDWQVTDTLSYSAGETTALGDATADDPVWRASDRETYRVFGRRHNGWVQTPEGFGGGVGQFFVTDVNGVFTNPYTGPPSYVPDAAAPLFPPVSTVVQASPENFFDRPGQGTSDFYVHEIPITFVNFDADTSPVDGVYLDYVTSPTAWFWRGTEYIAPLWRVTASGLVANNVGTSGWYWEPQGTDPETYEVTSGGVLAWDGSLDELTETMGDSVPSE